ncbi:MAG: S8 family serine peptidase [Deferribacterota bacterium]|nr:S8 family serine peptidase [Deferribacterota bacterium]
MRKVLIIFVLLLSAPSWIFSLELPNDPYFPSQIYLYNDNESKYDLGYIGFYNYFKENRNSILDRYKTYYKSYPIIAVIDTNYDLLDEDMKDRFYINKDEIPNNEYDDDNNSWVDDYEIISIADGKTYKETTFTQEVANNLVEHLGNTLYLTNYPPVDKFERIPYYHGHIVSSIIAAEKDNNIGIHGIVPKEVKILPITAGYKSGLYWTSIREALDYIIDLKSSGLNIVAVNMSFGGTFPKINFFGADRYIGGKGNFEDRLKKLDELGILYIAAAGNYYHSIDLTELYPATYGLSNGIVVGAATSNGRRSAPSNYGEETVDIFAVAQFDNKTKDINDYYDRLIEIEETPYTSYATAIVSAVVGCAFILYPDCTPKQIKELILNSYQPIEYLDHKAKYNGIVKLSGKNGTGLITNNHLNYRLKEEICNNFN